MPATTVFSLIAFMDTGCSITQFIVACLTGAVASWFHGFVV